MSDYFLVHDPSHLDGQLRSVLGRAWRERSFASCLPFCDNWRNAAQEYARLYHVNLDETVLTHVEQLPFDRALWRNLAGELLLFTARELPELSLPVATLTVLLASDHTGAFSPSHASRADFEPIHQCLYGCRDLTFGPAVYRPDHARLNRLDDCARLAEYLATVRPDTWRADELAVLDDLDPADRAEELELAREWFAELAALYARTAASGRCLVVEQIR
jgi:hypothetical protein